VIVGGTTIARPWVVTGIALVHVGLVALFMLLPVPRLDAPSIDVVEIEFADFPPEPPPIAQPVPDPIPVIEVEASPPPRLEAPEPEPPAPSPAAEVEQASPETDATELDVLTQLAPAPEEERASPQTSEETPDRIDTERVAQALRLMSCQSLVRDKDETCPDQNPFDRAEALAAREHAANNPAPVAIFDNQNAAERFFSNQKRDRHMFPGMDADLFSDPLPPGAYNADRIRSGREPLWSEEMKRGFSKEKD